METKMFTNKLKYFLYFIISIFLLGCNQNNSSMSDNICRDPLALETDDKKVARIKAKRYEPSEQIKFEYDIWDKLSRCESEYGTRESEQEYKNQLQFEEEQKGKTLANWACKYTDFIPFESSNLDRSDEKGFYRIKCEAIWGNSFDAEYTFYTSNPPSKIYNNDILKFSGNISHFGTSGFGFLIEIKNPSIEQIIPIPEVKRTILTF